MREDISPPPQDPLQRMFLLLNGHCLEQALYVAAVLEIADLLAQGSRTCSELAALTGADRLQLGRLLRTLASVGVFDADVDGNFVPTPLGTTLRKDVPDSVWDRAIYYGSPEMWKVWGIFCIASGQESPRVSACTPHLFMSISSSIQASACPLTGI
jgi:hypothetical protein